MPFLNSATKENVVGWWGPQYKMAAMALDLGIGVTTVNGIAVSLRGARKRASSRTSGDRHGSE